MTQMTRVLTPPCGVNPAAALLRAGELVAFPTETVYGLGADATNAEAVARIFAAKQRPSDNPLIVHVASVAAAEALAQLEAMSAEARRWWTVLTEAFWPGPLTLVVPARPGLPENVRAGLPTVALRIPAHDMALALLRAARIPVAAPSANRSGRPSPTVAKHVLEDLGGRIAAVLDGGPTGIGVESTVLSLVAERPVLLRPGGISPEAIEGKIGPIELAQPPSADEAPLSPGLKHQHYAPQAPLYVLEGSPAAVEAALRARLEADCKAGRRPGLLVPTELASLGDVCPGTVVLAPGRRGDAAAWGRQLYAALRTFDELGVEVIYAEGVTSGGIGLAVADRLRRAAGGRIEVCT